MKTKNTPNELTAESILLNQKATYYDENNNEVILFDNAINAMEEYTSLKLQESNKEIESLHKSYVKLEYELNDATKKLVDYNFELTEQRDLQEREKDRYMKLWLNANNKIKTNYDEVEVLKQQIKSKDEMLEKMALMLNNSSQFLDVEFIKIKESVKELLNQYKQGK